MENRDYIIKLKVKNPFIAILTTFPMYLFYYFTFIFGIAVLINANSKIYTLFFTIFGFLFLLIYVITVIISIFYIYTTFKYKDIYIYNNKKVMIKDKIYNNVSFKYHTFCVRAMCIEYIDFYSNNKFIGRYFIENFSYKICYLTKELLDYIFFKDKDTKEKRDFIKQKIEENIQIQKQNRKSFLLTWLIVSIPIITILLIATKS